MGMYSYLYMHPKDVELNIEEWDDEDDPPEGVRLIWWGYKHDSFHSLLMEELKLEYRTYEVNDVSAETIANVISRKIKNSEFPSLGVFVGDNAKYTEEFKFELWKLTMLVNAVTIAKAHESAGMRISYRWV